jgi:hypothetical protein
MRENIAVLLACWRAVSRPHTAVSLARLARVEAAVDSAVAGRLQHEQMPPGSGSGSVGMVGLISHTYNMCMCVRRVLFSSFSRNWDSLFDCRRLNTSTGIKSC